jgi:citrate lyase subunit beta / citryl-CoA lyase
MTDGVAWLFCPADRSDRFEKAAASADVVILDLEDGVQPADRPAARGALLDVQLNPARTVVRVNPYGTKDHLADLEVLRQAGYRRVMLAKTESAEQVASLAPLEVVALCETPRGVLRATEIADCPNVHGLMWGAEDLVAGLGGRSSRIDGGAYRDVARFARSLVLLAAGASSKLAIDSVYLEINDADGLAAEAADAVQVGFGAKACIHPSQVAIVRAAYLPTEDESAWASRVIAAARSQPGVFRFEGQMVDEPVIRQARAILARAGSNDQPPGLSRTTAPDLAWDGSSA